MLQLLPLLSGMNEECSALEEARRFGRVGKDVSEPSSGPGISFLRGKERLLVAGSGTTFHVLSHGRQGAKAELDSEMMTEDPFLSPSVFECLSNRRSGED